MGTTQCGSWPPPVPLCHLDSGSQVGSAPAFGPQVDSMAKSPGKASHTFRDASQDTLLCSIRETSKVPGSLTSRAGCDEEISGE